MGDVVTSVLGLDQGVEAGQAGIRAGKQYGEKVYFKPYTMTTGSGSSTYNPATGEYTTGVSQPYQAVQQGALGTAGSMFGQLQNFNLPDRATQIFQEQSALLEPAFQQQASRLYSGLGGTGRLGLQLAGEGVGAGQGMVNPDFFGLSQAQSQALGQLSANARNQALSEAAQLGQIGAGALTSGLGISELENALTALGIDAETARSAAALGAGQLATGGYNAATQAASASDAAGANLLGGMFSAFGKK